jgi:hypothetical protein
MAFNKPPVSNETNKSCMPPSLRDLQVGFVDSVFAQDKTDYPPYIAPGIFPPERHIQIYRNNIFASLTEALQDVYPVVTRLVGEGFIKYAADAFIRAHAPLSGNLHDFGEDFATFLTGFPPSAQLEYLPDVARLEWAYHRVFHAAEAEPITPTALVKVPPERYGELRFDLHPAIRLLASDYPILTIWRVNQADHEGDNTVDLAEGGVKLMIVRRRLEIEFQPLSDGEFHLLSMLAQDQRFAAACETALSIDPEFDLARCLEEHVIQGTFVESHL